MQEGVQANLRERREALKLSQVDLAIRADCSPGFIAQTEAGYIPKRSKVMGRVLAALDDAEKAAA